MPDNLNNNANVNEDAADPASVPDEPVENETPDKAAADAVAKEAAEKAAADAVAKEAAEKAAADAAAKEAAEKAAADAAAKEAAEKAAADAVAKEATTKETIEEEQTESDTGDTQQTGRANGNGKGPDNQRRPSPEGEKIFTWLTVGQYFVLGAIGVIIVMYLFSGLLGKNTEPFLFALSKP